MQFCNFSWLLLVLLYAYVRSDMHACSIPWIRNGKNHKQKTREKIPRTIEYSINMDSNLVSERKVWSVKIGVGSSFWLVQWELKFIWYSSASGPTAAWWDGDGSPELLVGGSCLTPSNINIYFLTTNLKSPVCFEGKLFLSGGVYMSTINKNGLACVLYETTFLNLHASKHIHCTCF